MKTALWLTQCLTCLLCALLPPLLLLFLLCFLLSFILYNSYSVFHYVQIFVSLCTILTPLLPPLLLCFLHLCFLCAVFTLLLLLCLLLFLLPSFFMYDSHSAFHYVQVFVLLCTIPTPQLLHPLLSFLLCFMSLFFPT